ncbi:MULTISPECIES: sulfite exporter TauE/SafE family protein [Ensifer]|jgi:uncharacterized membrane protein YfcA|uniref:Probable membrane transporter protein n=1 Tax=Ensifer canadensis TaxID=555315 RepID=A0AAW4FT56_9HYPH|nr:MULTISPECIES: sulfite exporter TauE/SafE family protein [Ensifer]AHK45021.1 putative transmembrane protein [Ensifer adhaerens OV14]MDP9630292.1 putative membrane protein YfcA [Ensifer adhaerens]KQU85762.1 permease [Ensifer sp. Root31]KQW53924.1 permease [Ensifer sp. Root1252]KQW83284.1 permease [Ensifer sp. Root127]
MDGLIAPLLFLAGIAGGIINALAGGATLITFPAMLAAGLPPVVANASNAIAIAPGHLLAAIADREKLPTFDRRMLVLHALCVVGGVIGALVLLALPDRLFVLPVPGLIGLATLLFAFAPRIGQWTVTHRGKGQASRTEGMAALFATSIYGGFFGAGLGILLTAVLSLQEPGDIRKVKVMKNLLGSCVSLAAIVIFIAKGMVQWPETLTMLSGALIGGYAGGHLVRVLPAQVVRLFVILSGAVMTCVYAGRYWF